MQGERERERERYPHCWSVWRLLKHTHRAAASAAAAADA